MHQPNPAPDLSTVPGGCAFATVSLLALALFVGQALLSPVLTGVLVGLAGLVAVSFGAVVLARRVALLLSVSRQAVADRRGATSQSVDVDTASSPQRSA